MLIYDRNTGSVAPVGPGTEGLTATSGITWDRSNNRLIAFDNADNEFYAFDTSGNGTLLSVASGSPDTWAVAHDGQHVVMQLLQPSNDRRLAYYDPDTGMQVGDVLHLSDNSAMEALDFVPEPSTLSLVAAGLLALAFFAWRRKW